MLLSAALVLCFAVFVASLEFNKPVTLNEWPKCNRGQKLLNDCNWCECINLRYSCAARKCEEVDMFGHFNDAIREINVGMEGHGSWRTTPTACQPGVQYLRDNLVCICGEDGAWPNPVCRDVFRILHEVETSLQNQPIRTQKCQATKLYLIGCNVCFCPSTEQIDVNLCTKINCTSDEPFRDEKKIGRDGNNNNNVDDNDILEVYAECQLNRKYNFGCRRCMCLRNNRLLCEACDKSGDREDLDEKQIEESPNPRTEGSLCDNLPAGEIVENDCNLCMCDKRGLMYCTSKKCLGASKATNLSTMLKDDGFPTTDRPYSDLDCTPKTTYWKDCNKCVCNNVENGQVYYSCILGQCSKPKTPLDKLITSCVKGTVYEYDCQICRCDIVHGSKMETCHINSKCTGVKAMGESRTLDIKSLHGYCEPGHTYQRDCNTCRCLPNGKILMCTSKVCKKNTKEPIIVDVIPIVQNDGKDCPKSHMYYVDCNVCFCLDNGNVICSTADCNADRND